MNYTCDIENLLDIFSLDVVLYVKQQNCVSNINLLFTQFRIYS